MHASWVRAPSAPAHSGRFASEAWSPKRPLRPRVGAVAVPLPHLTRSPIPPAPNEKKMLRIVMTLALLSCAAGLALPTRTAAAGAASPAAAAPLGRRQAVATAFGAVAALAGAGGANAYDAIPVIEPDFAAMELQRKERLAKSDKKTAELRKKINELAKATNGPDFIKAADDVALWVIGEGSGARRGAVTHSPIPPFAWLACADAARSLPLVGWQCRRASR